MIPAKRQQLNMQFLLHKSIVVAICTMTLLAPALEVRRISGRQDLVHRRVKRALYELPAGASEILNNQLRSSFTCDGLGYGYYADQDNDCKIFHVCQSFKMSDGSIYNNHWSFLCGNQTVFNQVSLSCSHPEDSIPCQNAKDFYHVNDYFGDLQAPAVKDQDLVEAQELVSRAYGARLAAGDRKRAPAGAPASNLLS